MQDIRTKRSKGDREDKEVVVLKGTVTYFFRMGMQGGEEGFGWYQKRAKKGTVTRRRKG